MVSMEQVEDMYPERSMMRWICEGAGRHPDKCLLATADECCTYAEAREWAVSLACYLDEELGLGEGSTIALSAPNVVQVPVVLAAAQLLGARVALLSPTTGELEFERGIGLVRPQLVIASERSQLAATRKLAPDTPVMLAKGSCPAVPSVDGVMRRPAREAAGFPHADADALVIVFTSGSTGAPKAIANRASSFALNGIALRKWLGLADDDVVYLPVPLVHVFGLVGMYATLAAQATFATSPKYGAEEACAIIEATRATVHLGVPTNFIRELRENEGGSWDLGSLRAGLVAGADCPPMVIEEFEKRYGCKIMQSYGMSETAATLTVTPLDYSREERIATVGFCIDGAQAKVDSVTGEIMCRSASLMEGVLQPDGSLALELDDGWLRTGDVGTIDERGMLAVTGRLKNAIVRGGINVFPSEIAAAYEGSEDVAECCAFALEDEELGQRICLAVVLRPDSAATAEDLRAYAKGRIDKYKVPDAVLIVGALPYLGNGKVDRAALERLAKTMPAS